MQQHQIWTCHITVLRMHFCFFRKQFVTWSLKFQDGQMLKWRWAFLYCFDCWLSSHIGQMRVLAFAVILPSHPDQNLMSLNVCLVGSVVAYFSTLFIWFLTGYLLSFQVTFFFSCPGYFFSTFAGNILD